PCYVPLPPSSFSTTPPPPQTSTLSLHDALPICGIFTGVDTNLGDLPFHIAVVSGFAYGDNFPPQHPEFAGVRLTYPFVVDFVTADRKSTRLNSSHSQISYAVFCLKKKKIKTKT